LGDSNNLASDDMPQGFDISRQSLNVINVNMEYKKGWEQLFLLCSDVHFDNPDCDRKLFKKHLDKAVQEGAGILINGDFFCLMEGRSDPRSAKKIRKEHLGANWLDNIIEDAADFLAPYAANLIMIGVGNHESAILKRSETNVIERLCALLKYKTGQPVYNGQYSGFIRFMFKFKTVGGFYGGRMSKILHYHHGWGGSSNMTKGVNKHIQRLSFVPDADFHWMGHTHQEYVINHQRLRLTQKGKIYQDECLIINTSTYKDEFKGGAMGWANEKGISPKRKGGLFLRFYYDQTDSQDRKPIKAEVFRVK